MHPSVAPSVALPSRVVVSGMRYLHTWHDVTGILLMAFCQDVAVVSVSTLGEHAAGRTLRVI